MFPCSSAVERLTVNQGVVGSIPAWGATFMRMSSKGLRTLDFQSSQCGFESRHPLQNMQPLGRRLSVNFGSNPNFAQALYPDPAFCCTHSW